MEQIRPQDLNRPILVLVRERGGVRDAELHWMVAASCGAFRAGGLAAQPDVAWRFSAVVTIAKRRLLRYGLLRYARTGLLGITPLGELFLCRRLTVLSPKTRAWLGARQGGLEHTA